MMSKNKALQFIRLLLLTAISLSALYVLSGDNMSSISNAGIDFQVKQTKPKMLKSISVLKPLENISMKLVDNKPFLYYKAKNRFGNRLFEYAGAYCIAIMSNHTPTIPDNSPLLQMFDNIYAVVIEAQKVKKIIKKEMIPQVKEKHTGWHHLDILPKCQNKSGEVMLLGLISSFKYFLPCAEDVRKQFTIQRSIQKDAIYQMTSSVLEYFTHKNETFLSSYEKRLLLDGYLLENYIYVGVHVRRSDRRQTYAPITYFDKAISYYQNKYNRVIFYVCSDDIIWCKGNFSTRYNTTDILFLSKENQSYFVDFAILTNCNHSIITAGTFSFWVGWLTGGEVVYNNLYVKQKQKHPNFTVDGFYPTNWIGMD